MKPKLKQSWVAALRSGNFNQGQAYLRDEDDNCCCLGVLCDITRPSGWRRRDGQSAWRFGKYVDFPRPSTLKRWGLTGEEASHLAQMNDYGKSFAQIADYIEEHC